MFAPYGLTGGGFSIQGRKYSVHDCYSCMVMNYLEFING